MKKQILAFSLGLLTLGIYAQKNEIKAVEKALKKEQFEEAKKILSTLEKNEDAIESKYKTKYYYLKGNVYGKSNINEAAKAYNKLFDLEKESGKVKYTKLGQEKLNELISFVSKKAIDLYNNDKNYKSATEYFYLTYKISPRDTVFYYNAAISASQADELDKSLKYFQDLKEMGYKGIVTQYFATNKEGVEESFPNKTTRDLSVKTKTHTNPVDKTSDSKQIDIIKKIGFIYVKQGKPELAIAALDEARKANPKDLNLILNQADMYIKLKKIDEFEKLMKEAVKLDPNNHLLYYNLGIVNQQGDKNKEAIEFFKKAVEIKPDYADAYLSIAAAILAGEKAIVEEMNKNLNNFKKYEELEVKQKELYKSALPYLIKGDKIKRSFESVRTLLNIYDILEMETEANALRPIFKEMRSKQ